MSPTPEEGVKLAHTKLRRIESELDSLPESESVKKVRKELDAALGSTNPGEVRKRSSLGMFKATEVDKEFGEKLEKPLHEAFSTAMNLVPKNVDYDKRDEVMEDAQIVNIDDYGTEELAEDLIEWNDEE